MRKVYSFDPSEAVITGIFCLDERFTTFHEGPGYVKVDI
jgi:hypothetical protein